MKSSYAALAGASALAMIVSAANPAIAQSSNDVASSGHAKDHAKDTVENDDTTLQTLVVTGQRVGITNIRPTNSVSGLNQQIVDIPRSVTTLDSALLKDIQVRSIHDLTIAAAGTYTAAYFGVAGAVQIRGNVADSYYRGFKGINNLGYYETPTESVSNIEIVRGPVSPMYGTGKLGGMLNLTPKTDIAASLKEASSPSALMTAQTGSNSLIKITVEGGIPFKVGDNNAALYAYAYFNKNGSYYRDFHPNDKEFQLGYSMDIGNKFALNLGGRYLTSKGHLASPGWNRLTQDLIDNGTYTAGSPAISLAKPGAVSLLPADLQANINNLRRGANFVTGVIGSPTAYTALNPATVQNVELSRSDLNTSPYDYNTNHVGTAYVDLIRTSDNGDQVKLQGFGEHLYNNMSSAAGSATYANANVYEGRLSFFFKRDVTSWLSVQTVVGASYRHYRVDDYQNYGRRYVIWDRNDISAVATPDMIINNPSLNTGTDIWDFRYHSRINDSGAYMNTDIAFFDRLHVQGGVRYDHYGVKTMNDGLTSFGGALGTTYFAKANPVSYQVSLNYKAPFGLVPYITYANNKSLETNKGGGVDPALLIAKSYLSPSNLKEIGLKGSLFDSRVFFSLAAYKEVRSQRDQLSTSISTAHSKGIEAEMRARVTNHIDVLGTATIQRTFLTGAATILLTPTELGFSSGAVAYAGEWTISTSQIPSLVNGYVDSTLPARVFSLFSNYRFDNGLKLSGGGLYASQTKGIAPGAVHVPEYFTFRASGSYTLQKYTIDVAVDNITDKRYFYLGQGSYSDVAALPAPGRTFTVRFAAKF
jgi:iron complex outermembrane receptor protein